MVGHTGIIPATVKATEAIDKALGDIYKAIVAHGTRNRHTAFPTIFYNLDYLHGY